MKFVWQISTPPCKWCEFGQVLNYEQKKKKKKNMNRFGANFNGHFKFTRDQLLTTVRWCILQWTKDKSQFFSNSISYRWCWMWCISTDVSETIFGGHEKVVHWGSSLQWWSEISTYLDLDGQPLYRFQMVHILHGSSSLDCVLIWTKIIFFCKTV